MGDHEAPTPSSVLDPIARSPWMRTLVQGVLVDAAVAVGGGLMIMLAEGDVMSPMFWSTVGVLVIKSVLTSLASYLTRMKQTPQG